MSQRSDRGQQRRKVLRSQDKKVPLRQVRALSLEPHSRKLKLQQPMGKPKKLQANLQSRRKGAGRPKSQQKVEMQYAEHIRMEQSWTLQLKLDHFEY